VSAQRDPRGPGMAAASFHVIAAGAAVGPVANIVVVVGKTIGDTGFVEAGIVEAGIVEAGIVEAGIVEAGIVEAGIVEAGFVEAGFEDETAWPVAVLVNTADVAARLAGHTGAVAAEY